MYKNLLQASPNEPLFIVGIMDKGMDLKLAELGLQGGLEIMKLEESMPCWPVWVRGPWGDAILANGLADETVLNLGKGKKKSISTLNVHEDGRYVGVMGKNDSGEILHGLGIKKGSPITLMDTLPKMIYKTRVGHDWTYDFDLEGAARLLGEMDGKHLQYAGAFIKRPFRIQKILGDHKMRGRMHTLGITPGVELILVHLEKNNASLPNSKDHVTISNAHNLHLNVPAHVAAQILVRSCEICWNCGACHMSE